MNHKFNITVRDRLFAVGLMDIVVIFSFPLAIGYHNTSRYLAIDYTMLLITMAALIALVVDGFAYRHGSDKQRVLAVVFALPLLAFIFHAFLIWKDML